jgi:predicted ATPase
MQSGLAAYRDTGAELFCPHMLGLLAQVNLHARRFDKALAYCDEALVSGERSDVHFFDAEIHRLEGECILSGDRNVAAAETCFDEAITLARAQGTRMLELRGATSLAKLNTPRGGSKSPPASSRTRSLAWTGMKWCPSSRRRAVCCGSGQVPHNQVGT